MRRVPRQGTRCEIQAERLLVNIAPHYRKQHRLEAVTPDFVLLPERIAIFIDGDFWHGRIAVEQGQRALGNSIRGVTREFWIRKILKNVARDKQQTFLLRRRGWSVIRIWEHDLRASPNIVVTKLRAKLGWRRAKLLSRKTGA